MFSKNSGEKSLPKSVWIVIIGAIMTIMGISLIGPVLPTIAKELSGNAMEVSLLYTSFSAVMAVAMLFTGFIGYKLGIKKSLLMGLAIIGVFATIAGLSAALFPIILCRCIWGFGCSIFFAVSFTAVITLSGDQSSRAISIFEGATGIGTALGPFLGGIFGQFDWRYPFFAVGALMLIIFLLVYIALPKNIQMREKDKVDKISLSKQLGGIKDKSIYIVGFAACLYNFGFYTLVAYSPLALELEPFTLGLIFVGWGSLLAISSTFISSKLKEKLGALNSLYLTLGLLTILLLIMTFGFEYTNLVIACLLLSGAVLGNSNALFSNTVVETSKLEQGITSSSYSFLRFISSAIAPFAASAFSMIFFKSAPFLIAGIIVFISIMILVVNKEYLNKMIKENKTKYHDNNEIESNLSLAIKDFMSKNVVSVKSTDKLEAILKKLTENKISSVPVLDDNENLIGMISEGDIIRFIKNDEEKESYDLFYTIFAGDEQTIDDVLKNKANAKADEIMQKREIFNVNEDDNFEYALKILSNHAFKSLPVLNNDKKLVGMISRGDISNNLLKLLLGD
ncbi:MAG: MFS transporter [Methanobrevibacter sp.]|jgi:CBS domain-containing protein/MFS family permease|nr:MFS transporter [Candidatus Methanoflexus mossambicus]